MVELEIVMYTERLILYTHVINGNKQAIDTQVYMSPTPTIKTFSIKMKKLQGWTSKRQNYNVRRLT